MNEAEEIREAFQPYYEADRGVESSAEPQQLYELQAELDDAQVYHAEEVEGFARVFFTGKEARRRPMGDAQGQMNRYLDPAVTRFGDLDPADAEMFRGQLTGVPQPVQLPVAGDPVPGLGPGEAVRLRAASCCRNCPAAPPPRRTDSMTTCR